MDVEEEEVPRKRGKKPNTRIRRADVDMAREAAGTTSLPKRKESPSHDDDV